MEKSKLIHLGMNGDIEALGEAILLNKEAYYRLAYSFTFNKQDALDAISEMTIIILNKISQLKDPERFDAWSKTILVNCARKIIKDKKEWLSYDEEVFENIASENKLETIDLINYVRRLPKKQFEVIILRYYLDMEYKTIADTLNIPLGTVKSRINNGLEKLNKLMGGNQFE